MIKPGTMCVVVAAKHPECQQFIGKILTVTGPPKFKLGPYGPDLFYPTDEPRDGIWSGSYASRMLLPIDDSDQWAKDPAYTKRPTKVDA